MYDYGDTYCHWRNKALASCCDEQMEKKVTKKKKESRWKNSFENLDSKPRVMKIDNLVLNLEMKIGGGSNPAQIFAGLWHNCLVAVKRAVRRVRVRIGNGLFFVFKKFPSGTSFATHCRA